MAQITDLEVAQLNKMNKAAQNVELGTIIKDVAGGGSTPSFTPAEPVADLATDADASAIVTTVNALLASLRTAGILKS